MDIVIADARERVFIPCCETCNRTPGRRFGFRWCDERDVGEEGFADREEWGVGKGKDGEGVGRVVGFVVRGRGFWDGRGRVFDDGGGNGVS